MFFASDNAGPAHPKVLEALVRANEGYAMAYGNDPLTAAVQDQVREVFEAPDAAVHLVATGTAANSLILATLAQPWDTIYCAKEAHIQIDECNAPEFYTGGAKLTLIDGEAGKIDPDALARELEAGPIHGVHGAQRGPVSITQVTDCGTVFSLDEIQALSAIAKAHDVPLHMDGARFSNAVVALGTDAAGMSWKAGVDAVSFGGTKNGLMGVEAVVFFDPAHSWELELRRKRGAHLFSKHRYLAAQMGAYLTDGLWLELAASANAAAKRLADGLGTIDRLRFLYPSEANIIFAEWPRRLHRTLLEAGAIYEVMGDLDGPDPDEPLGARLVCDWSATNENTDRFLDLIGS